MNLERKILITLAAHELSLQRIKSLTAEIGLHIGKCENRFDLIGPRSSTRGNEMAIQRFAVAPANLHKADQDPDFNALETIVVTERDHIASHAFDEEKERELFEASNPSFTTIILCKDDDGSYMHHPVQQRWIGWIACAKSRAEQ